MVEGAFARAFKSGLRPVELGRRMIREMDDHRSVGVRGDTVVPNSFTVALSRSEEHTSELQSLMRISYAVFCLKKKIEHPTNLSQRPHMKVIHTPPPQRHATLN